MVVGWIEFARDHHLPTINQKVTIYQIITQTGIYASNQMDCHGNEGNQ